MQRSDRPGSLDKVTDVVDLHEWQCRHLEEHPLFERVSPEEETPARDPIVSAITRRTDESVKVAKVQGEKFVAQRRVQCLHRARLLHHVDAPLWCVLSM